MPSLQPAATGRWRCRRSRKRYSQTVIAVEAVDGLVGYSGKCGRGKRKIRGKPGVFGKRQHMAERRPLGDAAGNEIGRLQRKFRRGPALRQFGELAPIGDIEI